MIRVKPWIIRPACIGAFIGASFGIKHGYKESCSDLSDHPTIAVDIFVKDLSTGLLCGILWPVTIPTALYLYSKK